MGFYEDMQTVATDLLTEFNQGVLVLIKAGAKTGPAYAPTEGTPASVPLKGIALGVSKKYVDKGLAIATDKELRIAIPSQLPDMADSVTIDGQLLKIQHIAKIPEAGTPVAMVIIAGTR